MDDLNLLPDKEISNQGKISKKFLDIGISSFKEACFYVHNFPYGYNSDYDDKMILFKEKKGTCTSKHAVIAALADELEIPLYKYVGVYKFTEQISDGVDKILKKYNLPYAPMIHCFLVYENYRFDLTEGNKNGKKTSIEEYIHTEKVEPFITTKNEYLLLKGVIKQIILQTVEMKSVTERTLLKARAECIIKLKENI